jgi:hypothetical protein
MQNQNDQMAHNSLVGAMNGVGFQLAQQNGQTFFYNQQTQQQVPYQQAMQQYMTMLNQQRPQQQPQVFGNAQGGFGMQGNAGFSFPQSQNWPSQSVQAGNQRFTQDGFSQNQPPSESSRFGVNPPVQTAASSSPQYESPPPPSNTKEKTAMSSLSSTRPQLPPSYKTASMLPFKYVKPVKRQEGEEGDFFSSTLMGLTELIKRTQVGFPLIEIVKGMVTDTYHLSANVTKSPLVLLLAGTDAKAIYKGMYQEQKNPSVTDRRGTVEMQALISNMDATLTECTNNYLVQALGGTILIESFRDDFNNLLKHLRNATDFGEDELLDYLSESLSLRIIRGEGEDDEDKEDTFAHHFDYPVVIVYCNVLSSCFELDEQGQMSEGVLTEVGKLSDDTSFSVFYIATLDKVVFKVYARTNADKPIVKLITCKHPG